MKYILDSIEGYVVTETMFGLDVHDKDGKFVCDIPDTTLNDFKGAFGDIDEDELYEAIREEEKTDEFMNKLLEMNNC